MIDPGPSPSQKALFFHCGFHLPHPSSTIPCAVLDENNPQYESHSRHNAPVYCQCYKHVYVCNRCTLYPQQPQPACRYNFLARDRLHSTKCRFYAVLRHLGRQSGQTQTPIYRYGVFAAGSLICLASPSLELIVIGRAIQGFGAASVTPSRNRHHL